MPQPKRRGAPVRGQVDVDVADPRQVADDRGVEQVALGPVDRHGDEARRLLLVGRVGRLAVVPVAVQARECEPDRLIERAVLGLIGAVCLACPLQRSAELIGRRGGEREPGARVVLLPPKRVEQEQVGLGIGPLLLGSDVVASDQPGADEIDLVDPVFDRFADPVALLAWQQDLIGVLALEKPTALTWPSSFRSSTDRVQIGRKHAAVPRAGRVVVRTRLRQRRPERSTVWVRRSAASVQPVRAGVAALVRTTISVVPAAPTRSRRDGKSKMEPVEQDHSSRPGLGKDGGRTAPTQSLVQRYF